ncbi:carboxypeptidase-like regulatory domain-containing protein [Nocardioides sp. Soil805]|uniref:carboxypeptidase-like regulatory domain-containing protein n=1 Tax=Nocardioides sp. Soil805 TaxID=1736416 RepID=UPI000702651D|nr:carboxypeptidase-like regulatory domain-containing protein [Nocardioides sp. Soil805]KRF35028.1 hypothetical protein ASG94_12920 [Nocardioides sp. Soil805]
MIGSTARRPLRRTIASVAGTALVAAGLGLGAAPAHAADSVISGTLTDTQGNAVDAYVDVFRQQTDGTFSDYGTMYADNGYFSGTYEDGVYKFQATTYAGGYTEFYRDKADLATADAVTVGGGATALQAWTVDQPYVVGTVTDPSGRPVQDTAVSAYDAASGDQIITDYTDEKGAFVLPVGSALVKVAVDGNGPLVGEWYNDKSDFASADNVAGTAAGNPIAITLSAGGSISGQVLSDAGAPLEFVEVSANNRSDLTDKNGNYLIEGVPAGSYTVEFRDDLGEYSTEYYNNVGTAAAASPVVVGKDQAVSGVNANLTLAPAQPAGTHEILGTVKDDTGAPVVGAFITAWNTPNAPGKEDIVEYARSNRSGAYALDDLDQVAGENQFKVHAQYDGSGDDNAFALFDSWLGGRTSYDRATAVTVTPGTTVPGDITLMRAGGVEGAITGAAGLPLEGNVQLLSVDGTNGGSSSTKADNTFEMRYIYPGTYKVRFGDSSGNHVPEWWKDSTFEKATEITVKPGQMVTGLTAALGASLLATDRPETNGYPWVGKSISVDKGTWNLETGTTYSYEWVIGSSVVGTGASYTPTKAQIGDKLTVRVLAENGRLTGTATSAKTAKIGYKPKLKVKVKGGVAALKVKAPPVKAKKVKGKVVVKEIVKVKDNGEIKYKKIGKAKIAKGKGSVSLAKLKKGKHKLVFFFKGKGKVGSTEVSKKVKTKR